jgi:type IV pilus assembly protein PilX
VQFAHASVACVKTLEVNMYNHTQKGIALVVSIIVLLILTFLAVSTLQTVPVQEKIAGNWRDINVSLQTADSTLKEAENYLDSLADTSTFNNTNGLYTQGNAPNPLLSATWSGASVISSSQSWSGVMTPKYFIELTGTFGGSGVSLNIYNYGQNPDTGPVTVFRIVARSTGATGKAETIVESFYGRRF